MRKTDFKLLAFLTAVSFCSLSVSAYALPESRDDRVCVEQDILHSFENKFILLEQEKEALRAKLSSCVVEQSTSEKKLPVNMSQQDGQRIRYLEERVKELETKNMLLKDKLASLESVEPEGLVGQIEMLDEPESSTLFDESTDMSDESAVLDDDEARVIDAPDVSDAATFEFADETNEAVKPPALPDVKMAKLDLPQSAAAQDIQNDTGSAIAASEEGKAAYMQQSESRAFADTCFSHLKTLKKQALEKVSTDADQRTVGELSAQYAGLVKENLVKSGVSGAAQCKDSAYYVSASSQLASITEEIEDAGTPQRVIQILYQAVKKQESKSQNLR